MLIERENINKVDFLFIIINFLIVGFLYSYFLYFFNRINIYNNWNLFPVSEFPSMILSGFFYFFLNFIVCVFTFISISIQNFLPRWFRRHALEIALLCFWLTVVVFKNYDENGNFDYEIFRRNCDFISSGSLTECGRQNLLVEYWANVMVSAFSCIFIALIRNVNYGRMER